MTTFYKATHPTTGNIVLRKSNRDCYRFAAIGPQGMKNASFSGTHQGALNLFPKYDAAGWAVVPAVEITKEEFAAADKANKQFFKVKFMGKTYTSSRPAASKPYVCAVGYDRPAMSIFIKCQRQDEDRIEWLRKHGSEGSVERALAINERGGYDMAHDAERGVHWFISVEDARKYMGGRTDELWKATTLTLLDLE